MNFPEEIHNQFCHSVVSNCHIAEKLRLELINLVLEDAFISIEFAYKR
jgi:hypothetical protein